MSDGKFQGGNGSGQKYKPGQSGNPAGWGKERLISWREVARYANDKTNDGKDMIDVLVTIATDVTVEARTRAIAAEKVLDRIAGKPRQHIDMAVGGSALDRSDVSKMTDEELVRIVAGTDTTVAD